MYQHRPDINCIIHVQTPAVTAVSAMKCGLLGLSQEASICGPATSHSIQIDLDTNRLSIEENVRQSAAKVLVLPNHGILACGANVEEAWHVTFHLILACEAQLRAVCMGLDNLILPSDHSVKQVRLGQVARGKPAWFAVGREHGCRWCWRSEYDRSQMGSWRAGVVNANDRSRPCGKSSGNPWRERTTEVHGKPRWMVLSDGEEKRPSIELCQNLATRE